MKKQGKGRRLVVPCWEEGETEDAADHQEREESEQQSEGTADEGWLGSTNALTLQSQMSGAQLTPQKGAANRCAALAESGDSTTTTAHAGGSQRTTAMRPSQTGRWSDAPEWCWYTRAPRVQYIIIQAETTSVCAVAKDTPRTGSRLVEAVVD